MQALVFDQIGEARSVLGLRDVAPPKPGPGQALVSVDASPIHPADFSFVRGAYRIKPVFPQVAGLSGAGRIVAVGAGVELAPGTRVGFRAPGAWAELVLAPKERLYPMPEDVTSDAGSEIAVNPITAYGLLDVAGAKPGDWIALTAASSSVAALVAALAHERGLRVVGIAREASLPELAAEVHGVAENAPELAMRVRELTGAEGVAAVLDGVGGALIGSLFPALRPGATLVAYGTLSPEPLAVRNADLVYGNLRWFGFGIDRWLGSITSAAHEIMLDELWEGVRSGHLPLPVQAQLPLREFEAGLRLASGGGRGKVHFVRS
jgi:NADPH:quinone reductase-like Zn-dependent oxidoreductase